MLTETDVLARVRALHDPAAPGDPDLLTDLAALNAPKALREAGRGLAALVPARFTHDGQTLRPLRIAVAATFTAENVAPILRTELLRAGIAPELHVCGFDQMLVELSDPESDLAAFAPDITLCLLHDEALLPRDWDPTDLATLTDAATHRLDLIEHAVAGFTQRSTGTLVLHTVPLARNQQRRVISFGGRAELGRIWRGVNQRLLDLPARHPSVHVLDFEALLTDHPGPVRDDRLYRFASMAWTIGAEAAYAHEAAAFCRVTAGLSAKLVIVDLDNTLWDGVLGDDGPEGIQVGGAYPGNCYTDLQQGLLALRRQGVLLAVCSKNEQANVDAVLATHPELTLRPDDFVATVANWGRKDHNIRQIVQTLNIGLDSVVFVDDSPFECELVSREIPEVRVVRLSGDPAGHAAAVLEPQFFGALATTATDRERTGMYRARAEREQFAASFVSTGDYLSGLGLTVTVTPADAYTLPRIVQLAARTNQFNLNPRAHGESRTREMAGSPDHLVLGVEVSDRFGREGLVGAAWVAKGPDHWLIENFVLSCRVFSRGVEQAVLAHLAALARGSSAGTLAAGYRRGDRNKAAASLVDPFTVGGDTDGVTRYALDLTTADVAVPEWINLEWKESAHV
ncbi:HAD-IIIC family phosphatase [Micromonospora sp. NBC_01699]|uniref:HAD-IIIC family phosphatase n=1 Tax=Micromonospora sp. NBC_01699 TaxID=2975984 RepID=UPI002E2A2DA1|nr:HAD-IIIC family phosphatase [Micromonospora sp. NBC_01699]